MASSSSSTRLWSYDVFLSFRGQDTREDFIAHLCKALRQKGIYTYMDDRLQEGDEISPTLFKAIKESRTAIVVLSENYASSTWCLGELMEILACRETKQQIVLPLFYKVDPSDVRHQRKSFGETFAKHEGRFKEGTVQSWKVALHKVANLFGWHLEQRNEFKFIKEIVQVVSRMVSHTYLNVAKYPIGIESRVQDINVLLSIGMSDKRMVGIFGVGGIGKTTIVKAIYNLISYQFEDSCFLANIRENSKRECGLVQLQETLLFEILGDSSLKIGNVDRGINVIKERLCSKRVLLVLDDVDELIQLETLSGEHDCQHAFQSDKPNDDFVELTEHALCYAGGLPLALAVLGSNLYGRDKYHWKSALEKYKRIPEKNIHEKLKISYDRLEESEKNIFLDIACFFKWENVEYVTKVLKKCGFYPNIGIKVLMDKSLITIESNRLVMHDLLQDMGREIVRQESHKEPGKRTRLWFHEDVPHVLEENMGTNKIEGILVELPKRGLIRWSSETFKKMKSLRLFISRNAHFSAKPTYLPNELRVLDWAECPLQFLPSNFHGQKLTVLRMRNGLFKAPKEGFKNFQNLRIMEFIHCKFLIEIPDISRIPNLEKLDCFDCESLVKVHDSVGFLDRLTDLSFLYCSNLISLPRSLKLRSLENLELGFCSRLQDFPKIECEMECLRRLVICYIAIKELPSSTGYFTGLSELYIESCKNLMYLPSSILQLQHLKFISLKNCTKLAKLPTKEFETPSSTELFSSPPLGNSCIFDDGCSSIGFL
ncbi:disease resistance protein RPV1-like [Corylus avellana]|uniref:disease resistance protein RPV1-like n=1 Tax=Corylus avellana TaxID=13451 RepID=UPI00286B2435|nr:disease resistance protein RPV1-like [Corylus avellana]